MNLSEDEIISKKLNIAAIVIERLYYHMNMNGVVSHVDST